MRDTIDMAREVKATAYTNRHYPDRTTYTFGPEQLKAFEALVRADERKRIEQALDKLYGWKDDNEEKNADIPEVVAAPVIVETPQASTRQVGGDHYVEMGVQPWDVVDTWPRDQRIGYYRGGALKYLMRMGSKDESPIEVAKGQHYIQKLLEVLNESE
jgi:hypothetical protein